MDKSYKHLAVKAERMSELMDEFESIIVPWCKEGNLSLHQAFELSRKVDSVKYGILHDLWYTSCGRAYLRSCFVRHGGRLK